MFTTSIVLIGIAALLFVLGACFTGTGGKAIARRVLRWCGFGFAVLASIFLWGAAFHPIQPSHVGVVTTFGKIEDEALAEGARYTRPWARVHQVYMGLHVVEMADIRASSRDAKAVLADIGLNARVMDGRALRLFAQNPAMDYTVKSSAVVQTFVAPAVRESFKALAAKYNADELVTKREEVSKALEADINQRLAELHLQAMQFTFDFKK